MGHRKIPYGYTMRSGVIITHPEESICVRMLFDGYQRGSSFNQLVEQMKTHGMPYAVGKLWNKNMVARILANECYTGQHSLPAIITPEQFHAVASRRMKKQITVERSNTHNALRKICDAKVTPELEQKVLLMLNTLVSHPEVIQPQQAPISDNTSVDKLQKTLDEVLTQQPVDEESAHRLINQLASAEYDAISSSEYETLRIQHLLRTVCPSSEIDTIRLLKCVSRILVGPKRAIFMKLKNGQIIERSELL